MSTAVILEGQIHQGESEIDLSTIWSGHWRFIKDKKGTLQFNYKKIGYEVPKDLLEYVSFLDPTTVALSQQSQKSSNQSKNRKRGRGRPPLAPPPPSSSAAQLPPTDSNSLKQSTDVAHQGIKDDSLTTKEETDESKLDGNNATVITTESVSVDHVNESINDEPDGMMMLDDAFDAEDAPNTTSLPSLSTIPNQAPADMKPILIRNIHPLAGVWKGNFSITTLKGEELVEETLFFYSMLGGEQYEQFKDLPPEPQFPYTLLRRIEPLNTNKTPSTSVGNESSTNLLEVKNESSFGLTTDAAAITSTTTEVDPESIQDDAAATLAFGYSPAVLEGLYKKVLIGFGRNPLGRFSVAAIYDEQNKEFRCEKKYMAVKYAVKRGRRSHAEYALNYASQPSSGLNTMLPPPVPAPVERTASTRKNSVSSLTEVTTANAVLPARNRTNKLAQYIEEEMSYENAMKRKRLNFKGGRGKSKDWSDPALQSNLHALAGIRNPDNDDQNCNFREAFHDCDTGEIYEGGWAYGQRNGKGIVLYADGLMYEGNWYRGKEHGKGELMTGDRKVIYSGDWLDGQIHGSGTYNFGNGDRYVGDWKEGNRHGKGEYMMISNGCMYFGDWRDNKRHGKGKFIWPDGSVYEGEWENDTRHGRGVLDLANGFRYDGFWVHNVMEGKGTCTFPSGQSYQGTYKAGLRDGRGSVQFAEGPVYEGRFKEDRFDGQGTLKVNRTVPGIDELEHLIPIQIQSDLSRIHWKAGFGANAH